MITFFTIPKSFNHHINIIQRNAIKSWMKSVMGCEVILFGDDEGVKEIADEFGILHVADVSKNEFGTPLLDFVFNQAQKLATFEIVCYINCDILLLKDFIEAVNKINLKKYLMIGRRWDVDIPKLINFEDIEWEKNIHATLKDFGVLHPHSGIDYFVFQKGMFSNFLPFAVGRPGWDNWLVYQARFQKIPVVDATSSAITVHQNHNYAHSSGGKNTIFKGPEAIRNHKLAGGHDYSFNIFDATHIIATNKLKRTLSIWHLWRYFNKLPFLISLPPLIKPLIIKLSRTSQKLWIFCRTFST